MRNKEYGINTRCVPVDHRVGSVLFSELITGTSREVLLGPLVSIFTNFKNKWLLPEVKSGAG